jgi:hypothetical protein
MRGRHGDYGHETGATSPDCVKSRGEDVGMVSTLQHMPNVLTVNLAHPYPNRDKDSLLTGIDKRPTDDTISVRAPGPMQRW